MTRDTNALIEKVSVVLDRCPFSRLPAAFRALMRAALALIESDLKIIAPLTS